jgi:hypothetical protein
LVEIGRQEAPADPEGDRLYENAWFFEKLGF